MKNQSAFREVWIYIIFGVLTTAVNILVFYFFDTILGWQYLLANAIAIVLSILFAFWTNKKYVFRSKTNTLQAWLQEFVLFASFRALSGVLDMFVMWLLVSVVYWDSNVAKILTQILVVVLNYFFSKLFVFKPKKR